MGSHYFTLHWRWGLAFGYYFRWDADSTVAYEVQEQVHFSGVRADTDR